MGYSFSVVTICRNAENEIRDTIESVLEQNYDKLEYILIDGNSTDSTNEIIDTYEEKFLSKGFSFLHISEPDKGISDAFNKGILLASGDIIALINAGDGLLPGALKAVDLAFDENIDIIYGNTMAVDKQNGLRYLRVKPDNVNPANFNKKGLVFTHQSAFVKRTLYERVGLYDINFKIIMDTELFIRFYNNNAVFKYLDYNVVFMLCGGISSKASKRSYEEHLEIGRRYGGVNGIIYTLKYIVGIGKRKIKNILRKNKTIWYLFIGKRRNVE